MAPIVFKQVSLTDLDIILKLQRSVPNGNGANELIGFEHIFDDMAINRINLLYYGESDYCYSTNLRPFEQHSENRIYSCDYDVSIIALRKNELLGVVSMKWIYDDFGEDKLWNYRNRIISVKKTHQHKGIATELLKTLESTPEIQGKVLRFGNFTDDGKKYLKHVIPKIFVNKNYIVVPKDDWSYNKPLPKEYGCYLNEDYD